MVGPISYIGGKNRLAKQIIALLPEHTTGLLPNDKRILSFPQVKKILK